MQTLTAAPRGAFTEAQMRALLVAPDLFVDRGCDLLDDALAVVDDLTADLVTGKVSRNMLTDVHGTCALTLSRELAWGRDRVRPHMTLSSPSVGVTARWNLGAYLLTTPDRALGESPASFAVTGFDLIHLLQAPVGDSWSYPAGSFVLADVRHALAAAGITTPVLIDSTGAEKYLMTARSWMLTSSTSFSWLQICNELLGSIGYRPIYADQDGALRLVPYVEPLARPSEYDLAADDLVTGIVAADRTVTRDQWGLPNRWTFIRKDTPAKPVEGNGRYTRNNLATGLSSQASVGRVVPAPVVFLDATSQGDLVVQGDRLVGAAMRSSEIITLKLSPFPAVWHADCVTYTDDELGFPRRAVCRSWDLPLDGTDMNYVLETVDDE